MGCGGRKDTFEDNGVTFVDEELTRGPYSDTPMTSNQGRLSCLRTPVWENRVSKERITRPYVGLQPVSSREIRITGTRTGFRQNVLTST